MRISAAVLSAGVALAPSLVVNSALAAVTPYSWIRAGEAGVMADSSGNNKNFNAAFSCLGGGNPAAVVVNFGAGGPLGPNAATSVSCTRWGSFGCGNSGMWIQGPNNSVPPPDQWSLPAVNWVMECWVLPVGTGGGAGHADSQFVSTGSGQFGGHPGGARFTTHNNGDGTINITAYSIGDNGSQIGDPALTDTTHWIHVAVVNDNGITTFYVDGVAHGDPNSNVTAPSGVPYIGSGQDTGAPYDGYLDEVRYSTFAPGAFAVTDLLTRPPGPGIVSQPESATVWEGGAAPFDVQAVIDANTTYQWRLGADDIFPETGAELFLPTVSLADSGGVYSVLLSSGGIDLPSANATLTVVPVQTANVAYYRAAVQAEASLVAFYPVDGDTGLTVGNVVDHSFDGTLQNNASYDGRTNRAFGERALRFKGDSDVSIPNNPAYEFAGGSGTIEAIVYLTLPLIPEGNMTIFSLASSPTVAYYQIQASPDGSSLVYDDSVNSSLSWPVPGSLTGRRAHVAMVFSPGNVTAYVDGDSLGTKALPSFGGSTGLPVNIGSSGPGASGRWNGTIDELAIYGSALSANTIAVHNSRYVFGTAVTAPVIQSAPTGTKNLLAGGDLVFQVKASGTAPLSYQWKRNGVAITGNPSATTPSLEINPSTVALSGDYTVTVSNDVAPVTSDPFTLNFTAPPDTYSSYVLADSPSAYWRLNETSGTVLKDSAGGLDGTYSSSVNLGVAGPFPNNSDPAVHLAGAGSPVANAIVPYTPILNPSGPFSVEFWAKPDQSGLISRCVIGNQNRNTGRAGYAIYQGFNVAAWEGHVGVADTVHFTFGQTPVVAGQWYHVVLTWDGVNNARIYVNGHDDTDVPNSSGNGPSRPNLAVPFEIGSRFGSGIPYPGTVDEVVFYNHALTAAQVEHHFSIIYVASAITTQPAPVHVLQPATATVVAAASGFPNTYKWFKDGVEVTATLNADGTAHYTGGVTSPTLVIAQSTPDDSGVYHLEVTNPVGGSVSADATVTVDPDVTPPVALFTSSIDGNSVDIVFNEKLDPRDVPPGTARDPFNYVVDSLGFTPGVTAATLQPNGTTLRLTVVGLAGAATFNVTISGVSDYTENNTITSQTLSGKVHNYVDSLMGANQQGYTIAGAADGEFQVSAGGVDVWDPSDSCNFLYQTVSGDFDVKVHVASVTQPNNRDGLMCRQTLDVNGAMVCELMQGGGEPGPGVPGQSLIGPFKRDTLGGAIGWVPPHGDWDHNFSLPHVWLRLKRNGDLFQFFNSPDGVTWTSDGTYTLVMTDPVYLGLASNNGGSTATPTYVHYTDFGSPITTAGITVGANTTISVCFPECVVGGPSSATDFFNYTINGGAATISQTITLLPDNKTVLLTVSGLTGNSYTLDITGAQIQNCAGGTVPPATITGTVGSSFTIEDIGAPTMAGSAFTCASGQLGIVAGGNKYGGTPDQLTFAYVSVTGDFDKKVQITSITASDPTDGAARGGIEARASSDPADPALAILATNPTLDNAVRTVLRADAGKGYDEISRGLGGVLANLPNQWLRMKRVGNSFQTFVGTNGVNWSRAAQSWREELPATVLLGIYGAASKEGSAVTVQFANYSDVDLGDHTSPTLVSVGSLDKKVVGVKFSETINSATATVLANYTVRNANNTPATIDSAKVGIEGDSVYLYVSGLTSDTFTVSVNGGVTDSAGNVIAASSANGKVQPWVSDDIGFIQNPGSRPTPGDDPSRVAQQVAVSSDDNPEVEIVGGGSNLWDAGDFGSYLHRTVSGDFDVMVEVSRYDRDYLTGGYPNAGLMARNSLYNAGEEYTANGTKAVYYGNVTYADDTVGRAALPIWRNSPHDGTHDSLGDGGEQCCFEVGAGELIDGINGTYGSLRAVDAAGTPGANTSPISSRWLRIKRVGNHFTSYASFNGVVWKQFEELDHPMNATVEIGMFTMNDSGASAPPNNSYDGGPQRPSMYSVVHVKHLGFTKSLNIVHLDANSATLSWQNAGTLQIAPTPSGPWTDSADQSNPQTIVDPFFNVNLSGAQDATTSTGTGSGSITLSGNTLTFNNITYAGLTANSIAAHIHGPGAPGVAAAVLYPLTAYTTLGTTSGSFNGTLTLVAGTGGFTIAQQLQQLESGQWYVNVHTVPHPGGEIRGQILTGAEFFRLKN